MKAIIFGGGRIEDYSYIDTNGFKDTLIISADGGYKHTEKLKLTPDIVIGDNDSLDIEYPEGIRSIKCPKEKDYTDTKRSVDYAIENGCDEIDIYGGLGGRLDHEFSNYGLLAYGLQKNVKIKLIDKYNEIWMEDKPFVLEKGKYKYVSFFPYGGSVEGFSIKGLKYEVEDILIDIYSTITSSNEFKDSPAEISFENGMVIVMLCDDEDR